MGARLDEGSLRCQIPSISFASITFMGLFFSLRMPVYRLLILNGLRICPQGLLRSVMILAVIRFSSTQAVNAKVRFVIGIGPWPFPRLLLRRMRIGWQAVLLIS